jgi:broad-specificity NMP kinase
MRERSLEEVAAEVEEVLEANRDKRVCILGTFCCGKSTLCQRVAGVQDMDVLVFPRLTAQEVTRVNQRWSLDVGRTMTALTRRHVSIKPGEAVSGTVLLECDLVVRLRISDELLAERTSSRQARFDDAKLLDSAISEEVAKSGLPVIEVDLG